MDKQKLIFLKNFLWGAATSSHQVEGDNFNDWSVWENSKERKNDLEKRGLVKKHGLENFISGNVCGHYNRYEEDFNIAESLGHNAHRFSIEWSRIEPEEGKFNEQEIEHYRKVIKSLRNRGMEPFVMLWHFTLPAWLSEKGGWLNEKSVFYFTRYAEKVVSALGEDVKFWTTLNEPVTYSLCMYLSEKWIYNETNIFKCIKQIKILANAHNEAYKIIKHCSPRHPESAEGGRRIPLKTGKNEEIQVGIVKNNTYFSRFVWWCPFEWAIAKSLKYFKNEWFLNKIKNNTDFIGLNYFHEVKIDPTIILPSFIRRGIGGGNLNEMGWRICPEGIYHVLKDLKKYNKPIYITENGIPDSKDEKREKFIKDHLLWTSKAVQEGADVRGYFYWSLLDNFEWAHGFWPKFGLVGINRETGERKIRPSAYKYAEIIKNSQK